MFKRLKQRITSPKRTQHVPPLMDQNHKDTLRYVIAPFPEILSSIEGIKNPPEHNQSRRDLFELEALLSSIIDSHHNDKNTKKGESELLPRYEEIYKEGTTVTLVSVSTPPVQALSPEAPTLKRKPHGLQRHAVTEEKSSREKALEALMRLLSASSGGCALVEKQQRPSFPEESRLGAVRRRAVENLAKRGWDMREVIPKGRVSTGDLVNGRVGGGC